MSALLAHFKAMQEAAIRYLIPEPYVDREGNSSAVAMGSDKAVRDNLFAADILYMLDGPEQRAAEAGVLPIPMVLYCPKCQEQHIDIATPEWDNPPHRSHSCQTPGCNTIWRPADVPTAGVPHILTKGKSDNIILGQE